LKILKSENNENLLLKWINHILSIK